MHVGKTEQDDHDPAGFPTTTTASTTTPATPTTPAKNGSNSAWRSLRIRNFRIYFVSQMISQAGTLMQTVAQSWLVLQLGGGGTLLGITTGLQFLPLVIFGMFAGSAVDRMDRRRFYMTTQVLAGCTALGLGLLTISGSVELWMVLGFALLLGLINAADLPAKQAIVYDIVPADELPNAVGLVTSQAQISRVLGPALAGVTIAVFGIGTCFLLNAASFAAVIVALLLMRQSEMVPRTPTPRAKGQVREVGTAVRTNANLRGALVLAVLLVGLAWGGLDVAMPLLATSVLEGDSTVYGLVASSLGVGAVVGALLVARLADVTPTSTRAACLCFAAALAMLSLAPGTVGAIVLVILVGAAGGASIALVNVRLRVSAPLAMQGRIMALWVIAALGMRPIGGPLVGLVADLASARWAFVYLACLASIAPLLDHRIRRRAGADVALLTRHHEAVPDDVVADLDDARRARS